jgi:hypothetical protein
MCGPLHDGAGLGCFEHHPGERFMRCFIDRCIEEDGLRKFSLEELTGLISVSGCVSVWLKRAGVKRDACVGPSQGLSGTRHKPDPSFTRAFLGAFMDRDANGMGEQVC